MSHLECGDTAFLLYFSGKVEMCPVVPCWETAFPPVLGAQWACDMYSTLFIGYVNE